MYQFHRIAGAARMEDGRIVVGDGGSNSLRFFDATGRFISSVGREGGGPGEFRALQTFAVVPGDTIVAGPLVGELSYFDAGGQFISRHGTMTSPADMARMGIPVVLTSLDGSGRRVVGTLRPPSPRSDGSRWVDSFPVAIVEGRNLEVKRLGMLPSMEMAVDGGNSRPVWFGANATFTSNGSVFYIGFGADYSIRVYTAQGELTHTIRRAWTPVRVTEADIDRYVEEWGKRWITTTGAEADAERKDLGDDPYARTVPAFSQFIADRAGRLWVREAHLADAPGSGALNTMPLVPSTWSLFDPAGRWLGDVTMPVRFQPSDIGADYVLGTAVDADGVQSIVLYPLVKR